MPASDREEIAVAACCRAMTDRRRAALIAVLAALGCAAAGPAAAQEPVRFAPPVVAPAGDGVRALAVADLDGSGTPDVLTADGEGALALHPGDGRGGLLAPQPLAARAPRVTDDVTGDGLPDLVDVGPVPGGLAVGTRVADGRGGFGATVLSPADVPPAAVLDLTVGDVDGDGVRDLVAALAGPRRGAELWVAPGRGGGVFDRWWYAEETRGKRRLVLVPGAAGERPSVAALDTRGRVWVSPGDPLFGFAFPWARRIDEARRPLGDVVLTRSGGDGQRLAVVDTTRGCIALVDPRGPGRPVSPCGPSAGPVLGLAAGDLDGDGDDDLVHGGPEGGMAVITAEGGALAPPVRHPVPLAAATTDPLLADLDEDGRLDVVVVADLRLLAVFRQVGGAR